MSLSCVYIIIFSLKYYSWIQKLSAYFNTYFASSTVFIPFRSCYYLLYQCLVPNTREALSLLVQHYSVPRDFERSILSGEDPRVGNQGILNYLLIVLRRDKDLGKFWKIVKSMVNQPKLEEAIKQVQKGIHICNAECNIHFLLYN